VTAGRLHYGNTSFGKLLSRLLSKLESEKTEGLPTDDTKSESRLSCYEELPGLGLLGAWSYEGAAMEIAIGNLRLLQSQNVYFMPEPSETVASVNASSVAYVSVNGHLAASITSSDPIAADAASLIESLHAHGLETYIMTGDASTAAIFVANHIGIKAANVFTSLLPSDKAERITRLERQLGPVIMIGDNINDGPALFAATLAVVVDGDGAPGDVKHGETDSLKSLRADVDAFLLPKPSTGTGTDDGKAPSSTTIGMAKFRRIIYLIDLIQETERCIQRVLRWSMT